MAISPKRFVLLQGYFLLTGLINAGLAWLPGCLLRRLWLRLFGFRVAAGAQVHRRVRLTSPIGLLEIGEGSIVGPGCLLDNRRGIRIGRNVNLSRECCVLTLGHDLGHPDFPTRGESVQIDDDAWLFMSVRVMPGCRIGANAVVFPFSVVTREVPASTVWGGMPARHLRDQTVQRARQAWYGYWLAF
ncbi:acyltransferase [Sphaerotilus uruguayifluvii]|uniref:Acetyltransferase-like isoleucine patch superfamily enzyme n=1 Tax=Sphaerotilus uruguayifluvii TaxID=2735897 RepID=A0ABX2GAF9_9BURK|nr:acyltransferase [Leptothrix sp. C29]NRT58584.1 acetyltransferase-like isoleucine patch superfamily enzyme [Leptothrix sp. C29]